MSLRINGYMKYHGRNLGQNASDLIDKRKSFNPLTKNRFDRSQTAARAMASTSPTRAASAQTNDAKSLMRQNQELRDRLQEEASLYRRRLDTYKQAQQNQAALVGRLQSKVLQYKQKCNDLEVRCFDPAAPATGTLRSFGGAQSAGINAPSTSLPYMTSSSEQPRDFKLMPCVQDDIFNKLENDKLKCDHLMAKNEFLRQQLEESHRTNVGLTNDLQKLSFDWDRLREEVAHKENEWKEDEQAFNDYYNSEQNRLIEMWHDIGSVRRSFKDMQASLKSDLHRMQQEMSGLNRDLTGACTVVSDHVRQVSQNDEAFQKQADRVNCDLKSQIDSLKAQNDNLKYELLQRDQRIQDTLIDLRNLETRCADAENHAVQNNRLNDEIERLTAALRDIAHVVVQDAESNAGNFSDAQHLHLSQTLTMPPKSPKCGGIRTSQAFAEGTISAVQSVLHKYQLVIHDLHVRLQTNLDELQSSKKQFEAAENARENLTSKLMEMTEKLDAATNKLSETTKERDSLQRTLDAVRNEKYLAEKEKGELNIMIDALNGDIEKIQASKDNLQKILDNMNEERKMLDLDLQCIIKDKEITEMNLRAEESRSSSLREDTITLREELNKLYLTRDLLEQQRLESEEMLAISEKQRADVEFKLEKLFLENAELKYHLDQSSSSNSDISGELKELNAKVRELEAEREKLQSQIADQTADIASLKKELIAGEQQRLDLDTEKLNVSEKLKISEINKEKVELDLSQLLRERSDLTNQLTAISNKKDQLGEELMRMQQRLEQSNEMNARLNRSFEELMKENEEKLIVIESHEKEIQRQQEHFAALRSEKEALEGILFDTNTNLEASQNRCEQLDREVHDLITKQENMKSKIAQLTKDLENSERRSQEIKIQMNNSLRNQEAEFLQKVAYLNSLGEDNMRKWNDEKEQLKSAAESRLHGALQALETAKNGEIFALKERLDSLQLHLESVAQQHEEVLIRAENEKQQALLLAHRDKQSVADKLEQCQRELKIETETLERLRRESAAKSDRDRENIKQLNDESAKLKTKTEEQKIKCEEDIRRLELQISMTTSERDVAIKEIENLKSELRLADDKSTNLCAQVQETSRKLKECEMHADGIRKELVDCRRALAESNIEREKYVSTNKELRDHIKRVEGQRREQGRNLEEAIQKLVSLEEARVSLENDRTRITTLLKETQNNMTKLNQDYQTAQATLQKMQQTAGKQDVLENELQSRLTNESEERERVQQELQQLKKQLAELDDTLQNTRQDLGRTRCKANQDEHRWHTREQELLARLEEGRGREKCIEDQKHNLEVCLADATQQIQELKARLGGAEGRVRALDEQLMQMESCKKDVEHKLTSVLYTLKRIAGIQFDGSITAPHRLMSPSRRFSPARSGIDYDGRSVGGDCCLVDIDPEMIRKSVRKLMQQVGQVEREKEEYKAQLQTAKKQLDEAAHQQTRSDNKMSKLQQMLRAVNEDKANLESKLVQKQLALQGVEDALKLKSDDLNLLMDKFKNLESQLCSVSEQRSQCEDRLEKSRQAELKLESEKRHLQDELSRSENRASKLDLQRIALEGDIQRLQMVLQEKENHLRNCQERLDSQSKTSTQLEERCISLKTSVDQLKERLQSAALTETELRGELTCLQKERSEQSHSITSSQDKLKHLQKLLANNDNDRRVMAERLEAAQCSINELHRQQQSQQDIIQRMQNQTAELEVQKSTLEAQLRIAKWNQESGCGGDADHCGHHSNDEISSQLLKTQREKNELRLKVETLNEKLRQIENDKLSKFSENVHFDRSEKRNFKDGEYDSNRMQESRDASGALKPNYNFETSLIKQENHDLKIKIRRIETLLAEKESELARLRAKLIENLKVGPNDDCEKYRAAQLKSERLLETREQHHRQQVLQLENQISMLKEQLAQEAKRRQMYILRSSRAGREMQQLRQTLGDSLRHIAHDPVDAELLENETRRLDTAVSLSLPPTTGHYDMGRNISPRSPY